TARDSTAAERWARNSRLTSQPLKTAEPNATSHAARIWIQTGRRMFPNAAPEVVWGSQTGVAAMKRPMMMAPMATGRWVQKVRQAPITMAAATCFQYQNGEHRV